MNQKDLQLHILGYISLFDDEFTEKIRSLQVPETLFDYPYRPIIRALNKGDLTKAVEELIPYADQIQTFQPSGSRYIMEANLLSYYKQLMTIAPQETKITDQELVDAIQKDTRE